MSKPCEQCDMSKMTEYLEKNDVSVTPEEVKSAASEIMKTLGANACTIKKDVVTGTASQGTIAGIVTPLGGGGFGTVDTQTIKVGDNITSVGCQTLTLIAQKYAQTKKTMISMLNCNCQSLESNVALLNKLDVIMENVTCNEIFTSQSINATVKMVSELSNEQKTSIESLLKSFLKDTTNLLIKDIAETVSQTEQKVTTVDEKLVEDNIMNSVNVGINSLKNEIIAQNQGKIKITKSTFNGPCKFTQDIMLNILADTALKGSLDSVIQTQTLKEAISESTIQYEEKEQEQTKRIFGTLLPSLGGMGNGMLWTGISLIIVAIILFLLLGGFNKLWALIPLAIGILFIVYS